MGDNYKLVYFDLHGLGEPIRLMCADNNITYTDQRVTFDEWKGMKPTMAFGQLPCLCIGEHCQIVQSGAIIRHLARKHKLYGDNECDMAYCDMFYDGIRDLHTKYTGIIYRAYDQKPEFVAKELPVQLEMMEKLLKTKKDGKGYVLGGDKMCFVDYVLFEELHVLQRMDAKCLDKFPALKDYYARVKTRPSMQAYLTSDNFVKKPLNGNGKE